jgi:ribosome-binding factor A
MPGHRPERVAEMVHRELAERLRTDIKDPRVTPISITRIQVNRDLSRAEVAYLPLGGGRPTEDLSEGLSEAARRMRGPIGRALRLRHAPEIVFTWDADAEEAFRVLGVLDRLRRERAERDGDAVAATGDDGVASDDAGGEE